MEQARLVDVRSSGEFAGGHLDRALNIPVGDLAKRMDELGEKIAPLRSARLFFADRMTSTIARAIRQTAT